MDKRILDDYLNTKKQMYDVNHRIERLEKQIERLEAEGIVSDTVACGKKGKKALGTVKIEGIRDVSYQKTQLYMMQLKYAKIEEELLNDMIAVEDYIEGIEDREVQTIMRLRYLDGKTWNEVAFEMEATEDSVRKVSERYLAKESEETE